MSNSHIISRNLSAIKPSPTIALTTRVIELKNAGKNVISLGAGEPDFDTPEHIKNAAKKAMDNGQTKYTPIAGTLALREAIINKFKRDNGITFSPSEVTVGNGGKQLIFNAFMASLNAEDEVIIPSPFWVSYPDMVLLAGGKPVILPTKAENNFLVTAEELDKAITKNTKWIIINSPSNPTGYAYSKESLLEIIQIVKKHPNVNIMSDDIYEHLVYDDFKFYSPITLAPELKDRILTINGVSKTYSMTGWRIGFAGGNKELIEAMNTIQSQTTSNAASISQAAAVEALNGDQSFIKDFITVFQKRRDFVTNKLNAIPGISVNLPNGAFYVFASISGLIGKKTNNGVTINDCSDFAAYLLEEKLLGVVPGAAFGMPNYFRISYATSDEILETACEKIKEACLALS